MTYVKCANGSQLWCTHPHCKSIDGNFGTNVKVEASTFNPGAVWLFIRNSPNGPVKGSLNLNEEQAREVVAALTEHFGGF